MLDHRLLERVHVHRAAGHLARDVGDRLVLRIEIEQDANVAELQAAIDERDAHVELRLGRNCEVDRKSGPADSALGREEADDSARPARCRRVVAVRLRLWQRVGEAVELDALSLVNLAN